jgi:hypothetical protein
LDLIDILGWSGSLFLVVAYGLNSYQVIKSDSLLFYSLNIIGGIFLIFYSVNKTAYANTFINVVWVAIAIPAIIREIRKQWHGGIK